MQDIIIRKYKTEDREAVRRICCETAFMGEPLEVFFSGRQIFADLFTSYYTDYEPESLFVAEFKGEVVGYLMGCLDTAKKGKIFSRRILPRLLLDSFFRGIFLKRKNGAFFMNFLKSLLRGEFIQPKIPSGYPAHLHIDIQRSFRRSGIGTMLMNAYLEYLAKNNVPGVHLGTFSGQGRSFFLKSGFIPLWEAKTSLWRYILEKDIPVSALAKKIVPV